MNISFKANITVDKNLTKKLESDDAKHIDEVVSQCQQFMNFPVVKKITEGDNLDIYMKRERGEKNFPLHLTFSNNDLDEPCDIVISAKPKQITFQDCLHQICMYFYFCKFKLPAKLHLSSIGMKRIVLEKLKEMNDEMKSTSNKN